MTHANIFDEPLTVRLFLRWYRIRKARPDLVPALIQEPPNFIWTYTNPVDPWGSRTRLTVESLEQLVARAEAAMQPARIEPQSAAAETSAAVRRRA